MYWNFDAGPYAIASDTGSLSPEIHQSDFAV